MRGSQLPGLLLGLGLRKGNQEGEHPRAGIFKKSMGARHRGGIGFSYRVRQAT